MGDGGGRGRGSPGSIAVVSPVVAFVPALIKRHAFLFLLWTSNLYTQPQPGLDVQEHFFIKHMLNEDVFVIFQV